MSTDKDQTDADWGAVVAFDQPVPPMMLELAILGMRSRVAEVVGSLPASQRTEMIDALIELLNALGPGALLAGRSAVRHS